MKRKFQFLDKKKIRSKRFCQCDGDGRVFLGNFFPNIAISSTYIFWYRSKMLIRVFLNFHSLVVYESCSFLAKFSEHSTWGRIQFISNVDESWKSSGIKFWYFFFAASLKFDTRKNVAVIQVSRWLLKPENPCTIFMKQIKKKYADAIIIIITIICSFSTNRK